jgi:23S rRNA pseudouridine2605 synthase
MPTDKPDQMTTTRSAEPRGGDRIAKLLARAGVASRREIERMIAEGRIALDGVTLETPATILKSLVGVTVDGESVEAPQGARLFLHHKPTGLLVTERDPAGRPTIYDRLPTDLPRLVPVGRLDLNTEGLLLLTTDGGLKRQLELPATGVERAYRARTYGPITQAQLEELSEGVEIEGIRYGSIDANLERRTGANAWIELVLTEGKNREVRRVLEHLGLQVSRLIRTRYGPFLLGDLAPGEIGEVKQNDLVAFRKTLDGPKRGKTAGEQMTVEVEAQKAQKAPRAPARVAAPAPAPAPVPRARAPREPAERPARPGPQGFGVRQRQRQLQAREPAPQREPRPPRDAAAKPFARGVRKPDDAPRVAHGPDRSNESPWTRQHAAPGRPRTDAAPAKGPAGGRGHPPRQGSGPSKGPAGGRGHPPRAPKGKR